MVFFSFLWWMVWDHTAASILVLWFSLYLYRQWTLNNGQPAKARRKEPQQTANLDAESRTSPKEPEVLIIGAGAAGLSIAAWLQKEGISFSIVEKEKRIGESWRNRYDRLHLHTTRNYSALPFLPMPSSWPRYPSKDQVASYLEGYASIMGLDQYIHFETTVKSAVFNEATQKWTVTTVKKDNDRVEDTQGEQVATFKYVVCAVGENSTPYIPDFKDLNTFKGPVLHTSKYKNGEAYRDKRVLVIGCGNSAGEIAIDLWEHGAKPVMFIRSPLNIIPRFMAPIAQEIDLALGFLLRKAPPEQHDGMPRLINKLMYSDLAKFGIVTPHPTRGVVSYNVHHHSPALLDLGTFDLVRSGEIGVIAQPHIDRFTSNGILLEGGAKEEVFDAVVMGTGYTRAMAKFLTEDVMKAITNQYGVVDCGKDLHHGLYFIGGNDNVGRIYEMGLDAHSIATNISAKFAMK